MPLLEYVERSHVVGVRNDTGAHFMDFCSTHSLAIGGTTFQHRTRDKMAMSKRFRGCLEDIRSRKVADIGNLRDHPNPIGCNAAAENCGNYCSDNSQMK